MFREQGTLEAVLITKDGNPDGNLLGIVRPRDIYKQIERIDFVNYLLDIQRFASRSGSVGQMVDH